MPNAQCPTPNVESPLPVLSAKCQSALLNAQSSTPKLQSLSPDPLFGRQKQTWAKTHKLCLFSLPLTGTMERQGTNVGCLEKNVAVAVLGRPPALDMHLLFGGEAKPQEEAVLTCIARDLCPLPGVSSLPWNHKEMIRPNKINVI